MPTSLGRLLPRSRNLCYQKLNSEVLLKPRIYLQNVTVPSAARARLFSRCFVVRGSSVRGFKRIQLEKEQAGEPNASQNPQSSSAPVQDSTLLIQALDAFLPPYLCTFPPAGQNCALNAEEKCAAIIKLLAEARQVNVGADILAELGIKRGRWAAVMWVVEALIADTAARRSSVSPTQLPSNLAWPTSASLADVTLQPIDLDQVSYSNTTSSAQWDKIHFGPRETDERDGGRNSAIEQIWMSLGSIILASADLPFAESGQVMKYVYQIIARLHHSGFVPENVYSYIHSGHESSVRRPPIMHLLSSRILTTLSDAVWRAHQDEVIAQAISAGATYQDLSEDAPGGRFRRKARDLGPEVWLEFVLWCCVDDGFAMAGAWIVERMRTDTTNSPWFATQWTGAGEEAGALVDWDRVKLRYGDPVGQIEGYSHEKPFVEMQHHTISIEVVLALVEASINARRPEGTNRACTQRSAQTSISKLLLYLEPHNLPQKYFDYLTVRLFEPLLFDFEKEPALLLSLVDMLMNMHALETTNDLAQQVPSLQVHSVLEHSEVYAGVLHQTLESFAVAGRVHPTVDIFDRIQDLVDQSRLRSIGSFLEIPQGPEKNSISSRDFAFSQEYTSSHGQLPPQKLAAFLDLVTDTGMNELGQWLFYSMDVDGPLIPLDLYSRSSLTPSILRFAAATEDLALVEDVADMVGIRFKLPPVSYMRSFADVRLQSKDFEGAGHALAALNQAKGGGTSLAIVARLIATIIKAEDFAKHAWEERRARYLSPGLSLLEWILRGDFLGVAGDFKTDVKRNYRRGLACLLRIVEAIPNTTLSHVATSWIPKLPQSNVAGLNSRTFDIVLSAVCETRGAKAGMMLWDIFCKVPEQGGKTTLSWEEKTDTKIVPVGNGPAEGRISVPPEAPPTADISLLPETFDDIISEESVYANSTNDDDTIPTSSLYVPVSLVMPTFRTLSIIIRVALQELEVAKRMTYAEDLEVQFNITGVPAQANMRASEAAMVDIGIVEQWARPLFRQFGLTDEEVAVEFGSKLGEKQNIFSTEELALKHGAAKTEYDLATMDMLEDLTEFNIHKNFNNPPIRRVNMDVLAYTGREKQFYSGTKSSANKSPTNKRHVKERYKSKVVFYSLTGQRYIGIDPKEDSANIRRLKKWPNCDNHVDGESEQQRS